MPQTARRRPSNSNPNQIQYAYNAQGRMKSYSNSATGVSANYTYDAAGQRTQSAVTVGGVTTTTTWVYDGLTLMSQQVMQGSNSWRIDYLYNEDGTPIGGVYRSPANSTSPVFFAMITNSHGDVCELLDSGGNAFAAYHYDAWGLPQSSGSYATGVWTQSTSLISSTLAGQIASEQVLRYASYVYDPESGLYYCSARYYDPVTRQWTTADSAKADGEESAYQYCGGNPADASDPTGTKDDENTSYTFTHVVKNSYQAFRWDQKAGYWDAQGWGYGKSAPRGHLSCTRERSWSNSYDCTITITPTSWINAAVGFNVTSSGSVSCTYTLDLTSKQYGWIGFQLVYWVTTFDVTKYVHAGGSTTSYGPYKGRAYDFEGWRPRYKVTAGPKPVPATPANSG